MLKSSDLTEVGNKFTLIFNDTDGTTSERRHFMIDKVLMFDDNKLNTQNTSYEFILSGSIVWNVIPAWPTMFFFLTGAFHTSNNTFDVFRKVYINKTAAPVLPYTYRYSPDTIDPIEYLD